jgi:hypothetical protein
MKTNLSKLNTKTFLKFKSIVKKNLEFVILISTALIVILIVQAFNFVKEERKKHLLDVLNNVYFEKTLHVIFNNLEPKYINIEHKISPGESFNSILTAHDIPLKEINKIKKELSKKNNLDKLKTSQIIKFTVDVSDSKKY